MRIIPSLKPKPKRKRKGKNHTSMSAEEYHVMVAEACSRMANRDWRFTCDDYGRVHTAVTSLPKQLRCCLLVDGRELVELDLANSQPLIAGICALQFFSSRRVKHNFLKKEFGKRNNPYSYRELQSLQQKVEEIIKPLSETQCIPSSRITTCKLSEDVEIVRGYDIPQVEQKVINHAQSQQSAKAQRPRVDLEEYIRLCEKAEVYERLMEPDEDRDELKIRLYEEVFFGTGKKRSKLRNRFVREFPSVAEMLRELKKKNYKHSSHVLQNFEATIFIHTICRRIMQEQPDITIFTIHDSILTLPENAEYIQGIIEEEFRKLGVEAKVRRKPDAEEDKQQRSA